MVLKYLVYVLTMLSLVGIVSAGSYVQTYDGGLYDVIEVRELSAKFVKEPFKRPKSALNEDFEVTTGYELKGYEGYSNCHMQANGCIECEGSVFNLGYGETTDYSNMLGGKFGKVTKMNVDDPSPFRVDYKEKVCGQISCLG